MKKRINISPVIISACASAYMLFVFVDLTFLTVPDVTDEQSLVDKFFPVVFLVVGLYMLRVTWDQYRLHRDGRELPETERSVDDK